MARRRRTTAVGTLALALATTPGVVAAHEIAGRFAAPLPLPYLYGGAAAAVALTALLLGVRVGDEREAPPRTVTTIPAEVAGPLRTGARIGFLALFVLGVAAGLAGRQVAAENPATLFVWPVWVKGVGLLAAVFGSPWRTLSPWRATYDWLSRLEGADVALLGRYPERLGSWPALAGVLLLVGVVENLTVVPRSPRATALVAVGYAAVVLAGGLAWGRPFFARADPLELLYDLFGRVAPLPVGESGDGGLRIRLRAPWRGCVPPVAGIAVAAVVVASVYTVSFDGAASTPEFQELALAARDVAGPGAGVALYLAGYAGFLVAFAAVAALTRAAVGDSLAWRGPAVAFAPTLLPIAVAYEVAHNYPFALGNAGRLPAAVGGFLGVGVPVADPLAWLSVSAFWWSQVGLVVAGHVVAVVAAHRVALARHGSLGAARRAHLPLVVLMVAYTVLSLWLVSRPVVA